MSKNKDLFFETVIYDCKVTVDKVKRLDNTWFCAYVTIPDSTVLSDEYVGFDVFRPIEEPGVLLVDSNHAYQKDYTEITKFADVLADIKEVIIRCRKVLKSLN